MTKDEACKLMEQQCINYCGEYSRLHNSLEKEKSELKRAFQSRYSDDFYIPKLSSSVNDTHRVATYLDLKLWCNNIPIEDIYDMTVEEKFTYCYLFLDK